MLGGREELEREGEGGIFGKLLVQQFRFLLMLEQHVGKESVVGEEVAFGHGRF